MCSPFWFREEQEKELMCPKRLIELRIDGTLMGHLRPTPSNKRHMTLDLVGFALWGFESPLSHQ